MLTDEHCKAICEWVESQIGLALTPDKKYLVEHRLEPIAVMNGFKSINELIDSVIKRKNQLLHQQVIDSLVTNETYFFRDPESFVELKEIIKSLYQTKSDKTIRIWSAACSTGQEVYSIALAIHDLQLNWNDWKLELIGTDISSSALQKATKGLYNHFEVQRGLHITQLLKWFRQDEANWIIKSPFLSQIRFETLNLLSDSIPYENIDVLFLRNVLIYFDNSRKKDILRKLRKTMTSNGYLILGGTETAFYLNEELKRIRNFKTPIYQYSDNESSQNNSDEASNARIDDSLPTKQNLGNLKWPSF